MIKMIQHAWAFSGLIWLFSISLPASTLKLSPDIELLVLDGQEIYASLLKGAERIELEKGLHQFLFRVHKSLPGYYRYRQYLSSPLIVTFTASTQSVSIQLPPLKTQRDRQRFNTSADFQLIDEKNHIIDSQRDKLPDATGRNLGQAMLDYNNNDYVASVSQFAKSHLNPRQRLLNSPDNIAHIPKPKTLLPLWYQRLDDILHNQQL